MSTSNLINALKITLQQELELLARIDDEGYSRPSSGAYSSSVGKHIRHNLDHFEAFFAGVESGHIDYESRSRNELVERSTAFASKTIEGFVDQLDALTVTPERALQIREEDGSEPDRGRSLLSSCGRELQFLLGHTVHHHALIAQLLGDTDTPLPGGFGVAPSTQRYQSSQASH